MEEGETDAEFGPLDLVEPLDEARPVGTLEGTGGVEIGVGEPECRLGVVAEVALPPPVVDPVDTILFESLLLRDREADVASIPAVGDSGVADPDRLLGRVIDLAVAPELGVQIAESTCERRLVGEDATHPPGALDRRGKTRNGAHG